MLHVWSGAYLDRNRWQRLRCHVGRRSVARRRDRSVLRCRLSRSGKARRKPRQNGGLARSDEALEAQGAAEKQAGPSARNTQSPEGEHADESGASVSCAEKPVSASPEISSSTG